MNNDSEDTIRRFQDYRTTHYKNIGGDCFSDILPDLPQQMEGQEIGDTSVPPRGMLFSIS